MIVSILLNFQPKGKKKIQENEANVSVYKEECFNKIYWLAKNLSVSITSYILFGQHNTCIKTSLKRWLWVLEIHFQYFYEELEVTQNLQVVGFQLLQTDVHTQVFPVSRLQNTVLSALLAVCNSSGEALDMGQQMAIKEVGSQLSILLNVKLQ